MIRLRKGAYRLGVVIGSAGFLSEAREINERIEIVGRQ